MGEQVKKENSVMISGGHRSEVYEKRIDFNKSLFKRVYKRAYSIVQENVNIQLEKDRRNDLDENIDNVITFMGRRGTGKSSAMHSFMKALLDNETDDNVLNEYTVFNKQRQENERIRFIGIDWIDASLLERGEDIFEAILAKMLNEFMKNNDDNYDSYSYDMKDLYNEFASIYKKHLNLKKRTMDTSYSIESAIADLRDLSRSADIRGKFQDLIKKYIHIKSYGGDKFRLEKKYETFLVVAIDDIDMNIESGFEILEKLQRYLKVERLIILIAVNHEQMKLCCEKHFSEVFSSKVNDNNNKKKEYISSLADQYLEKVLPSYARVYLPSLKKMDYDRNRITQVKIKDKRGEEVYYPIKKAMFIKAWNKTMVRYDVEGLKRHFMEPESLRELNNLGLFRDFMPDLEEDSEDFLEILDFNYRRSMDDLLFRYADEKLPEEEGDIFVNLSELDIRRRGQKIVALCKDIAEEEYNEREYKKIAADFLNGYEEFDYSYGELLHSIYCMGRLPVYDKKLIHAILAMYSLTLTKIYYRYKKSGELEKKIKDGKVSVSTEVKDYNSTRKDRNYKMLKELLEKSVGGSWSRHLMPIYIKYEADIRNNRRFSGTAQNVNLDVIKFEVSKSMNDKLAQIKRNVDNNVTKERKERCNKKCAELVLEMKWYFILMLFFTYKDKYSINDFTDRKTTKSVSQNDVWIVNDAPDSRKNFGYLELIGKADYNVMNFINNIFLFEEKLKDFVEAICNMVDPSNKILKYTNVVAELKTQRGFYNDMNEWTIKYGGMVVPVYSMDVYYNMFKRLVRKQETSNEQCVYGNQLYETFKALLIEIKVHLEENDRYYNQDTYFVEGFKECPFIKEFIKETTKSKKSEKDDKIDKYNIFIENIIGHSSNSLESYKEKWLREAEF